MRGRENGWTRLCEARNEVPSECFPGKMGRRVAALRRATYSSLPNLPGCQPPLLFTLNYTPRTTDYEICPLFIPEYLTRRPLCTRKISNPSVAVPKLISPSQPVLELLPRQSQLSCCSTRAHLHLSENHAGVSNHLQRSLLVSSRRMATTEPLIQSKMEEVSATLNDAPPVCP